MSEPSQPSASGLVRRRQVVQGMLAGASGLAAMSLLAACGGSATGTAASSGSAAATSSAASSSAAPTSSAAATTSSAPSSTAAATTSSASSAAAATTSSASSTTESATSSASASTTESSSAAASTTSSASKSATSSAAANGGVPQTGGVAPTPRAQTVIIDQTLFHVFDSFNSFIPNGYEYEAGYNQACREWLFYANYAQGKVQPWLGTGWKYNSDFTEMTITLNPNVKWSDGQAFTSKDVAFTTNMLIKNPTLLGGTNVRKYVDTITTPDDHTITFKLKTANPRFHYSFICGIVSADYEIVPEHIWSKQDPTTFKDNPPVRTGPYLLDQTIPNQLMFVWKKSPNYWNKANLDPKPQYVVYRTAPVQDSDVEEFKRAETDLGGNLDYQHMQAIKASGYQNIAIETTFRDPCPRGIWINSDPSKGILADPRMHWVVSYLTDRNKIGNSVWLIQTPAAQYPWADYKSNDVWTDPAIAKQYALTYDPAKAASLLDDMGAKAGSDGKRTFQGKPIQLEIMTPVPVGQPEYEIAVLVAGELSKLGVQATARSYQGPVFDQKNATGEFDIASYWLCGVSFDPDQLYSNFEISKAAPIGTRSVNGNNVRLHDKALSDDAEKLDVADPAAAATKPLFTKALGDYFAALPALPVIQTTYPTAFNTTYWTNWPTDDNLYNVPANWWGQFLFTIGSIKPTGKQ